MVPGDLSPLTSRARRAPIPGKPEVPAAVILEISDSLALAARKVLARQAFLMEAHRPGTLVGKNPEELHDLRVASRRARAALRLLRHALPADRVELWRNELRWLGGLSGLARDLDVFLDRVRRHLRAVGADPGGQRRLLRSVQAQRRLAHAELADALRSTRLARLTRELADMPNPSAEPCSGVWASGSARDLAPGLIRGPLKRLRSWRHRRSEWLTAKEMHAIRIAGKRARYAIEFFADLLGGDLRVHLKEFVALQDCLGAHQDAIVALARLGELARQCVALGCRPEELTTLAALVGLERDAMAARRREFTELGPRLFALARSISRSLS